MIYHIAEYLTHVISAFNIVHYISVRAAAAFLTALGLFLLFGNLFIAFSQRFLRSGVRDWTPQTHQNKNNTPTMGGLFILLVVTVTCLLWCNWCNWQLFIVLAGMLGFGLIGACDDWYKIRYRKGIKACTKSVAQLLVGTAVIVAWLLLCHPATTISIPFFKQLNPDLGWFFIVWALFIIMGTSNGVNLTDGLDGLAIGSLITNFATFALICYVAGHMVFAAYLQIPFAGTAELSIIGSALVGASMGFLWYNAYPAQIFMGDVGSLGLGAALALLALMSKQELLLAISGGLFVIETLSVIMQVYSYKYLGKRMFKMAPIHHHFELLGWPEAKITTRFGIISVVLSLLALMTLKIR